MVSLSNHGCLVTVRCTLSPSIDLLAHEPQDVHSDDIGHDACATVVAGRRVMSVGKQIVHQPLAIGGQRLGQVVRTPDIKRVGRSSSGTRRP